jgi:hypothetical protein
MASASEKEVEGLAEEVLERLEQVSAAAKARLASGEPAGAGALASVNTLTSHLAIQRLSQIDQENRAAFQVLANEPAIARVVVQNSGGVKSTYYFCRSEQGMASAGVISYKTPFGRLASLPVGEEFTASTPGGRRTVEVLERAMLRPWSSTQGWDSRNTVVESGDFGPVTIESLRALLAGIAHAPEIQDLLGQVLAEESRKANIVEGVRRSVRTKMELRDQPVLDQFQDEIFRLPMDQRLLLLGPPGTGKTTTLIHRLGQKLNVLDDDERRIADGAAALQGIAHRDSWLMFTPTELLKEYLKEAFAREHVPASDMRIRTWHDYRRDLATEAFSVLRTAAGGGSFILRESAKSLDKSAIAQPIEWFTDFNGWQRDAFLQELRDAANSLAREKRADVQALGQRIAKVLEPADANALGPVLAALAVEAQRAQALIAEMRGTADAKIRAALNLQLNRNDALLDELAAFVDELEKAQAAESEDQEDAEDEEEEQPLMRTGRAAAVNAYILAVRAQARATASRRALGKTSRNAKVIEWLGTRSLTEADRAEVGASLLLQSSIRKFANPVKRYIDHMPRRYRAFRRQRQEEATWYLKQGFEARELHPLELDVILLAMLRATDGLINRPNVLRDIDTAAWSSLKPFLKFYRNQILVDEATDFSPIQLACMAILAHPQLRSFFACGDFNQRLTVWGARSADDLKWIFSDLDIRKVSITYRQSKQLNELARAIIRAVGGTDQDATLPEHVDAEGVAPALLESAPEIPEIVEWLARRIVEIARFVGRLPSTAIFVNSEAEVEPMAEALNAALLEHNVQVVPCVQGRVRGQDSDVRVFHIEHIKGLEFEVVFFVGVDRLAGLHPDLFDKYLYVGTTRAATYLGITCDAKLPAAIETLRPLFVTNWATR